MSDYEISIIPEHRGEISLGNTRGSTYRDFIYFYEECIGYVEEIKDRRPKRDTNNIIQKKRKYNLKFGSGIGQERE